MIAFIDANAALLAGDHESAERDWAACAAFCGETAP
jgi:hypothetical protein